MEAKKGDYDNITIHCPGVVARAVKRAANSAWAPEDRKTSAPRINLMVDSPPCMPFAPPTPWKNRVARGELALCRPFLLPKHSRGRGLVSGPVPTITTQGAPTVCQAFLLPQQSGGVLRPGGKPFPTISTAGAIAVLRAFLVEYYGSSKRAVMGGRPLSVVTTKPRFGLCKPVLRIEGQQYVLDVEYRMVTPDELARAMGFPEGYKIAGSGEDKTRQIGNAVEVHIATALGRALLKGLEDAA